jgi:hypothetical protein
MKNKTVKQEVVEECVHEKRIRGFPVEFLGYSADEGLALLWCDECKDYIFIQFDMWAV